MRLLADVHELLGQTLFMGSQEIEEGVQYHISLLCDKCEAIHDDTCQQRREGVSHQARNLLVEKKKTSRQPIA